VSAAERNELERLARKVGTLSDLLRLGIDHARRLHADKRRPAPGDGHGRLRRQHGFHHGLHAAGRRGGQIGAAQAASWNAGDARRSAVRP
jgi:hypothetical protein